MPFLSSEHTLFSEAVVFCISSFPVAGYSQLLEDLALLLQRQFLDKSRIEDLRLKAVQTFSLSVAADRSVCIPLLPTFIFSLHIIYKINAPLYTRRHYHQCYDSSATPKHS
jgi:hypothetical protein